MDVGREDHPPEAAVDALPAVETTPALDVPRNGRPDLIAALQQLIALRDRVRIDMHRYLDDLLGQSAKHGGSDLGTTMLDDIVVEVAQGAGFALNIRTEFPNAPGRAEEDPSVTAESLKPASRIHLA